MHRKTVGVDPIWIISYNLESFWKVVHCDQQQKKSKIRLANTCHFWKLHWLEKPVFLKDYTAGFVSDKTNCCTCEGFKIPPCCMCPLTPYRSRLMQRLALNPGSLKAWTGRFLQNQNPGGDKRTGSTHTQPEGFWQYMFPAERAKCGNLNTIWNCSTSKMMGFLQLELTKVHGKVSWKKKTFQD